MAIFFDASSRRELLEQLDWGGWAELPEKEFTERRQASSLLAGLAFDDRELVLKVGYPVRCIHRGQENPDFIVIAGDGSLGIEATQITNPRLEALRDWQFEEGSSPIGVGALAAGGGSRKLSVNIRNATLPEPNEIRSTAEDREAYYLEQSLEMIERKTEILGRGDFRGGANNWLLLLDRLSVYDCQIESRVLRLRDHLEHYWLRKPRFSKIFVQDRGLRNHYLVDASTPLDGQIVIHTPG